MKSCLMGGGRGAYLLDLEIIKSSPSSTLIRATSSSPTSSPSSTISGLSDSGNGISIRRPRGARKRLNQKYNEAAAILSSACPKIFSTGHILEPCKFSKMASEFSSLEEAESDEVLLTFPDFGERPSFQFEPGVIMNLPQNHVNCVKLCDVYDVRGDDYLDARSILNEEIEGIDSIMGSMIVSIEGSNECNGARSNLPYGYPFMGLNLGFGFARRRLSAFRNVDREVGSSPIVNVSEISPRYEPKPCTQKKKKKKKKVEDIIKAVCQNTDSNIPTQPLGDPSNSPRLLLKLNYDEVLKTWSDHGSPFFDENPRIGVVDIKARLAQIDLFGLNEIGIRVGAGIGGVREASMKRYKEKRHARLFSKKIRYQVCKVNSDQQLRMQGRFVRSPEPMEMPPDKRKRSKSKTKSIG